MPRPPGALDALLLTELYPPTIGGSAQLLANVYERFTRTRVTVLTEPAPRAAGAAGAVATIIPLPVGTSHWGLLHPSGLRHHTRLAWRVRRMTRAGAVVHCARALPEGLAACLSRVAGGRRYVCWTHGEELSYAASSRELTFLLAQVHRRAARVIANSRNTARLLESIGVAPSRIEVVYPGADVERFRPDVAGATAIRARLSPRRERLLLTVGRLDRRKGHDLVLRALPGVQRVHPDVRYIIVGDGRERARLEGMARDLGVTTTVTFVGAVAAEALPAYYAAADLFVHPNRVEQDEFEGFGIVFLEAAAAGVPVIAGNSGGAPEAIEPGVTGRLVSGTDEAELADTIVSLLDSPNLAEMGAAGRRRVTGSFSWERAARQTEDLHARVAAGT